MNLLYQHPTTISGVAVDGHQIATSCFDGFVRLFDEFGQLLFSEKRASQLQCVALRNGAIASDFDLSGTMKEGVAIAVDGQVIGQPNFPTIERILSVSKSGRFGVCKNQFCYDREQNLNWRVVPYEAGHDKWPMGVVEATDGEVFTVDQSGYLRGWVSQISTSAIKLHSAAIDFDLSDDQALFVVADENMGISTYNRVGQLLKRVVEQTLVHSCKFLPDRRVVYGTHDGRFCVWDGFSDLQSAPTPAPPPEPGKGKPGKGKK